MVHRNDSTSQSLEAELVRDIPHIAMMFHQFLTLCILQYEATILDTPIQFTDELLWMKSVKL